MYVSVSVRETTVCEKQPPPRKGSSVRDNCRRKALEWISLSCRKKVVWNCRVCVLCFGIRILHCPSATGLAIIRLRFFM